MTDKFEEWLGTKIIALRDMLRAHPQEGFLLNELRIVLYTKRKYREFLKEQPASALQQSNHSLGCELEAIATVLEFRKLTDEAETLRVVAGRLK